ncbi:polyprenyl synthetase family protein [Salinarimonas ramus]|uniref:Probable farnesyl diphosphate synthase n=1 Tax=Salinarimonas ramus TaxID=690164 RepID=A0A917V6N5_9HYPH|nr:polyprenyl synthetase family protein [Salinarimonas ramus]GGK46618.1 geranylgeranyl pyrophosphate synthase [Salinarimonas ramus]
MDAGSRIERTLEAALARAGGEDAPPLVASAMRYAVFPGGARIRPRLALGVAAACGGSAPGLAEAAAASIELLHCASLVHDDLPCFDDASTRRGKISVHCAFGEPLAVLAGDGLIVLAFEVLARAGAAAPQRLAPLVTTIAAATGMPNGIVAGQAWESEPAIDLALYHRAKTGALFSAATRAGAIAAGGDPEAWRPLGDYIGEAYQVADDLHDIASSAEEIGKPTGQDAMHGRASAPALLGVEGAIDRLEELVARAIASIPPCEGAGELRAVIQHASKRFVPKSLARVAA